MPEHGVADVSPGGQVIAQPGLEVRVCRLSCRPVVDVDAARDAAFGFLTAEEVGRVDVDLGHVPDVGITRGGRAVVEADLQDVVDLATAQHQLGAEVVAVAYSDIVGGEQPRLDLLGDGLHLEVAIPGDHGARQLARPPNDRDGPALADRGKLEITERGRRRRIELRLGTQDVVEDRTDDVDQGQDPEGHQSILPEKGLRPGRRDHPRWFTRLSNLVRQVASR